VSLSGFLVSGEAAEHNRFTMLRPDDPSDASTALSVRKANDVVGVRIRQGRLTLLSRKLFNVMLGHSQLLKVPGKDAPPGVPGAEQYFWLPLSTIVADADFNSNDTKTLQESAQSIQGIQVVLEDAKQWTSESLVASVRLAYPHGKGKGKPVWFGWAFPPGVHELVVRPSAYTHLSLYYQRMFKSGPALALWEVCRQYATSPGHRTPERDVSWWFHQLSGRPVSSDLPEYKYWKRDDLKPAVVEVNSVSDIEIALVEKRAGRRVVSLHFTTRMRPQESLTFPPPPLIDMSLREPIMSFGLSQKDTDELLRDFDAPHLLAAIEAMKDRMKNSKLPQITSRRAYLRQILKNGIPEKAAVPVTTLAREPKQPADPGARFRDELETVRRRDARALLAEMDADEREAAFVEFLDGAGPGKQVVVRKAGPLAQLSAPFHSWFAERTWGSITDTDVFQFAAERVAKAESLKSA